MTKRLDYEQLIKSILKEFVETNIEKNKEDLVDLVFSLSQVEDVCRAYPEITHVIYQVNDHTFHDIEAFFGLSKSNDDFAGLRQEEKLDRLTEDEKENLDRFERHVQLSCYQREYISKVTAEAEVAAENAQKLSKDAEKHANAVRKTVDSLSITAEQTKAIAYNAGETAQKAQEISDRANTMADKANKVAKEAQEISSHANEISDSTSKTASKIQDLTNQVQKKVSGIYSEFMGILAIFTALSFAMMGSVQMLGNLFNDIKHPTTGTLGYALILAGIYLIVIYLLIMTLVLAMKKLFSTISDEYRISWPFVWIISTASTLLILVGIFLIVFFKVSDLWTFYR